MKELFGKISSFQRPPSPPDGGLPYWIFWLLISFIFLLIVFIFLRDKQLRQRLNSFFFKLRKQLLAVHLHHKHKKELNKKNILFKEMGKTTWKNGIRMKDDQKISQQLSALDQKNHHNHQNLRRTRSELNSLHKDLKNTQQKIQSLKEKKSELKKRNHHSSSDFSQKQKRLQQDLHTEKTNAQNFKKIIQKLQKSKKKIRRNIDQIEHQRENLFLKLGKLADDKRIHHEILSQYYIQVDEHNQRIQKLENHLRNVK